MRGRASYDENVQVLSEGTRGSRLLCVGRRGDGKGAVGGGGLMDGRDWIGRRWRREERDMERGEKEVGESGDA